MSWLDNGQILLYDKIDIAMDRFENEDFKTFIENDIVHVVYKKSGALEVEVAMLAVEKRLEIAGPNSTMPLFIDFRKPQGGTKATRKYLATPESIRGLSIGAMLINSVPTMIAFNLYMKIDKPPLHMKVFVSKEKALNWLEQFKDRLN